jgi:hypothetical protein
MKTTFPAQQCGNANGTVYNDLTSAPIAAAAVNISGIGQGTGGSGDYVYQCASASQGYKLPIGASNVIVDRSNYYSYNSGGNAFYASRPPVTSAANNNVVVPPVGLWPVRYGTITATVTDAGSGDPLAGIQVDVYLGAGGSMSATTDGAGHITLNNVPESWPPAEVAGNPNYIQNPLTHSLVINASKIYSAYSVSGIILKATDTDNFNISLSQQGAT